MKRNFYLNGYNTFSNRKYIFPTGKKIERVNEESKSSQIRRQFTWRILIEVKMPEIDQKLVWKQANTVNKIEADAPQGTNIENAGKSICQEMKRIFREVKMKVSERHLWYKIVS